MSLLVETRPERALYNVEVTLRMVDQMLAELGGEPLPVPTGPCEQTVVDRVVGALALVESLGAGDSHATEMGSRLRERLRNELRALLSELPERVVKATRGASERALPAPTSGPPLH